MSTPALFIDRDGTLVLPRHYLPSCPDLRIYHGLGTGLRRLQNAGWLLVIITNQSGVARGYLSEADLDGMHVDLAGRLDAVGVRINGIYTCPHHPEGVVPRYSLACQCRKPKPGLLLRAAEDLDIDLVQSWFVGDMLDDVEAGNRAGCRTVLVDLGSEEPPASQIRTPTAVARNTRHALSIVATLSRLGGCADLDYCPPAWRRLTPPEALCERTLGEVIDHRQLPI